MNYLDTSRTLLNILYHDLIGFSCLSGFRDLNTCIPSCLSLYLFILVPDKGKRDDSILKERLCEALRDVGVRVEAERIKREAGDITFGEFLKRVRAYKGRSNEASVRMVKVEEGSEESEWREADKVKILEARLEELTYQFDKFRTSQREIQIPISTQPVQRKPQNVMRCMSCDGYGHWAREYREFRCRMCNALGTANESVRETERPQ